MKIIWILIRIFLGLIMGGVFYVQSNRLQKEATSHEITRLELKEVRQKALRLSAAFDDATLKITALQTALSDSLVREKEAVKDATLRDLIVSEARPKERSKNEAQEVIDVKTRKSAMLRLNRPF